MHVVDRIRGRFVAWPCVVMIAFAAAGCSGASVPMPPDNATPEEVVRAYVDAVHVGDCQTAAALMTGNARSWCDNIDITALTITERTQEQKATESGDGPMIERVWVTITTHGSDVSLPDGDHSWSYLLDRTGSAGAWRIYDQGLG